MPFLQPLHSVKLLGLRLLWGVDAAAAGSQLSNLPLTGLSPVDTLRITPFGGDIAL